MRNYFETIEIIEDYYMVCKDFWKYENHHNPKRAALYNVYQLKTDPFSTAGEKLDRRAIIDFLEMEA